MITKIDGKARLQIFQNFSIDRNLKKHKTKKFTNNIISVATSSGTTFGGVINFDEDSKDSEVGSTPMDSISWRESIVLPVNNIVIGEGISGDPDRLSLREMLMYTNSTIDRTAIRLKYVWHYVKKLFKKKKDTKVNYVALQEFFSRIPFNNISQSNQLVTYYEDALLHVDKTGQTALREKLKDILGIVRAEISLLDNNLTKYVSEEQMCSLYEKVNAESKLKLTWIKNFVKIIPTAVLDLKQKADDLEVFDNYVILHFDPNNDATNLTQEEERAKKDPIMFGVISESNKLYYIADWVDEYCDLTLEKMFETLQDKVLEINNESVKSFINNQK